MEHDIPDIAARSRATVEKCIADRHMLTDWGRDGDHLKALFREHANYVVDETIRAVGILFDPEDVLPSDVEKLAFCLADARFNAIHSAWRAADIWRSFDWAVEYLDEVTK